MSERGTWPPIEWLVEPAAEITAEDYSNRVNSPTLVTREGDVVWRFSSPPESWRYLAGVAGFALVRGGTIVHAYTRIVS
jgi:hypothetical protein